MTVDNHHDRVGVLFSSSGHAEQVVLDGGPGRFYYSRNVKDHKEKPPADPLEKLQRTGEVERSGDSCYDGFLVPVADRRHQPQVNHK